MNLVTDLITYLKNSPTPYQATENMAVKLLKAGYTELLEKDAWAVKEGKYFVRRNNSSIIALRLGEDITKGFKMVGAHTDSPCLKVRPRPEVINNYFQVGVEIYGGVLLAPWFDRDLSLAGRVTYRKKDNTLADKYVDLKRPLAFLPSLAIHMFRNVHEGRTFNKQKEMVPILSLAKGPSEDFRKMLLEEISDSEIESIADFDLFFYDTQAPAVVGLREEFLASARLDNLLSCYVGLDSFMNSTGKNALLICTDHEEVGSSSHVGASGPLLEGILRRFSGNEENYYRCVENSVLLSCDNAHGIHPNYPDKHEPNHTPVLNKGVVIKTNANQRYATLGDISGYFRDLCAQANVPHQDFVTRSDMGCGSTIGPITATRVGVKTLDLGVPTFGMHSIRELAGVEDITSLGKVLKTFYT